MNWKHLLWIIPFVGILCFSLGWLNQQPKINQYAEDNQKCLQDKQDARENLDHIGGIMLVSNITLTQDLLLYYRNTLNALDDPNFVYEKSNFLEKVGE